MARSPVLTEVETLDTIRAVLDWTLARSPHAEIVDAIAQDEFTSDVIVEVEPDLYLSFDVSSKGQVRSVNSWEHFPSPDELLAGRLADGWAPTPTPTKNGDVILGYAACLETVA